MCYDPANPLLNAAPCRLDTGVISLGNGTRAGALTVRTATTTVTVMLAASELATWAQVITGLASLVSGQPAAGAAGLARPTAADVAVISRDGRRS